MQLIDKEAIKMTKCCQNCNLYSVTDQKNALGYCEFWRKEVKSSDFCIEYRYNSIDEKENE